MQTIKQFVASHGLKLTSEWAATNPYMDGAADMDNWKCLIRAGHRQMTVYFSKGVGHHGKEPDIYEVLDCLASDAAGIENARDFDDWCSEYGYDTDSRKAERIYHTCQRQAASLRRLLGDDAYQALLWDTERE